MIIETAAPPGRGDTVQFTLSRKAGGATVSGKVTSAYTPSRSPEARVTIAGDDGRRYTRAAASVTVTRRAPASPRGDEPAGRLGQRPGRPAPNRGHRYAARTLTTGQVAAIIGQCSRRAPTGIRNRAMLMLAYRSGLRISEILALRPGDVKGDGSIRIAGTKTGEPQTRGYHPSADDALARWADTRRALALNGHHRLFCTLAGRALSEEYVRGLVRRLAARAGISERVTPHTLRHTYASELEASGMPISRISRLLGHSSIAITAHYLEHLTNRDTVTALRGADLPELPI